MSLWVIINLSIATIPMFRLEIQICTEINFPLIEQGFYLH